MAKTVVYGGTFNPIHMGHTALVRSLMASGEYDRLLLVPAAQPPHKDAPQLADGNHRLAMCRLATADIPKVEVCDWEIRRGGKSYTVETLGWLREQYPQDSFFLLIGTDMFLTFRQWREWQQIGQWATLLVAARTGAELGVLQYQQQLLQQGVHSQLLHNLVLPISSTDVRCQLAQTGMSSQLDGVVYQYCKEHGLYGQKYDLPALRERVRPLLNPQRYHHSLCVEQRAAELAERYGADPNQAAAAGILHDVCKNMPEACLLQMLQNCDRITDVDFMEQPQLLHSHAGALYLEREWGIADQDLLAAVRYHTTARAGMSLLEQIVYLADLTSSERDYPDVQHLRDLSNQSLNDGMLYALSYIAEQNLPSRGLTACKDTTEALAEYRCLANKQEDKNEFDTRTAGKQDC